MLHLHFLFGSVKDEANFEKKSYCHSHRRTGRGGGGGGLWGEEGCSYPQILGNSDFLGSKRKFGQSQFLKTFPCYYYYYYYFEEINIFYFNLKSA